MRRLLPYVYLIGLWACFGLPARAGVIAYTLFNETDYLSITLDPPDGNIAGPAGSTIGWGFDVSWTATDNFLSFTGSSVTADTNDSFLLGYTDFIGFQSGPDGIAVSPGGGDWVESYDGTNFTGVGSYAISSDPTLAIVGGQDTGSIEFFFNIYYGYPTDQGAQNLGSFSYQSNSTDFAVTVADTPPSTTAPEPPSLVLLLAAAAAAAAGKLWRYWRPHCTAESRPYAKDRACPDASCRAALVHTRRRREDSEVGRSLHQRLHQCTS
jgi:hypothetical protein